MTHHILFYDYVDDILERRGPYREAHLAAIRAGREAGRVVMAGAVGDPPHGAVIVFGDVEPEEIETFARSDPYVEAGLVAAWRVEPWNVV
ncbi:MAG TPA: YciI family protein [Solirubrobacteraceae bacterium]|nr:YciI family protein [Solirubrobacteraceae bacterium]